MQLEQGSNKYGWIANLFPYPIAVDRFDHMIFDLLRAGVTTTLYDTPKGIIVVTWKKPWEAPKNAVDSKAS